MGKTLLRSRPGAETQKPNRSSKLKGQLSRLPLKLMGMAALPTALLVYYLCYVAPDLLPVPRGVRVPFRAATVVLSDAARWCEGHVATVTGVAAALLLFGAVFKIATKRYYFWLTTLVTLSLVFCYLSISAPIDRLLQSVKENLPEERRTPDFLPGDVRR